MRVPEHLQHKPIIGVDNYDTKDGMYAPKSDAKALSIGLSQWDIDEISAKVWRHTTGDKSGKWSRQSEELPLHRVLDLAILIASLYDSDDDNIKSKTQLDESILDKNGLNNIDQFLKNNEKYLKPRLKELKSLLDKINL